MIERGRWYRAQMGASKDEKQTKAVRICVTATGRIYVASTDGSSRDIPGEVTLVSERDGVLHATYQHTFGGNKKGGGHMVAGERWFKDLVPE